MKLSTLRLKEIPAAIRCWCEDHASSTGYTYASYLEYVRGEMVERIFASRNFKKSGVKIHEVVRRATGNSSTIARDLIYQGMAGYTPVFEAKDKYKRQYGYGIKTFDKADFGKWYIADYPIGVSYTCINSDMVKGVPEFKYSGFSGGDVIRYLNAYRKDSSLEFFGKLGLPISPLLIKKAKVDGQFRKWLYNNHAGVSVYGVQATLYAYKHGITIGEAREVCVAKGKLDREVALRLSEIKNSKLDRKRVLEYVDRNNINYASYNDYLKCCKSLGLNLADTKVLFPKDFGRMHELRVDEYASQQAKADRVKRAELYDAFTAKSHEYKTLEFNNGTYSMIVPTDISELVREGEFLKHCVGKMGYDKKVVDGKSIIMFVRKCGNESVPYVTVEYRIDRKTVAQCYGYSDSKPPEEVVAFVDLWAMSVCNKFIKERNTL